MGEIRSIFEKMLKAVQENPEQTKELYGIFQFQFHDRDDVFQFIFDGENSRVEEGTNHSANCTMVFTEEDFQQLSEGKLNGTEAFMSGRLKILGDKVLALKLQKSLSALKEKANL